MKLFEFSFVLLFAFIPTFHGQILGGRREVPVDSPEIIRLSQVALSKLNEGLVGSTLNLVEITKAEVQVVSGTNTILYLKVAKGEEHNNCEVHIWEQPWLNKTEVTFPNCDEVLGNRGKRNAVSVEEEQVKQDVLLRLFKDFMRKYNKIYEDDNEYKNRYNVFRVNMNKIRLLRKHEQGTAQYGLTWFSDLTPQEFKNHLGLKKPEKIDELPAADIPNIKLPDQFDWRHYNIVTPVKDQKSCGSCWAFSVTGNVEGQWALKRGELLSLSEQELVSCDPLDEGCEGGYMTNAYKAIMKLGGLETESDYPYNAKDTACQFDKNEAVVKISGAVNITSDEIKMAQWLVKNGPISVALNANAMQFYMGGVSHPIKFFCRPDNLDHGVLIVGFGVHHSSILHKTLPYWIIKNSWGKSWGEKGYYRLYRGDGSCGINQMASSAIVN